MLTSKICFPEDDVSGKVSSVATVKPLLGMGRAKLEKGRIRNGIKSEERIFLLGNFKLGMEWTNRTSYI